MNVGNTGGFDLGMFLATDPLTGWLPRAVTADGLTEVLQHGDNDPHTQQAAATPGVVSLKSALVTRIDGTLTAFGGDAEGKAPGGGTGAAE